MATNVYLYVFVNSVLHRINNTLYLADRSATDMPISASSLGSRILWSVEVVLKAGERINELMRVIDKITHTEVDHTVLSISACLISIVPVSSPIFTSESP
jgi:hypothetical protein